MLHAFFTWLSTKMHHNHIWRDSHEIYMARYFTKPSQEEAKWFLHNIRLADEDGHHSHPYIWQCSLILCGSYDEETLDTKTMEITTRRRRWFNWIPGDKYHRIIRLHGPVWSLFLFGPKHGRSWGFWVEGVGHVHNEDLARVKAELDKGYWTEKLASTRYEGEITSGDFGRHLNVKEGTDPVHYVHKTSSSGEPSGWYFSDETWDDRHGPYSNAWEARQALLKYCKEVLGV